MNDNPYSASHVSALPLQVRSPRPRSTRRLQASLGLLGLAFGVGVWVAFFAVPAPIPWMMGEVAMARIMAVYGIDIGGSAVFSLLALTLGWRLRAKWLMCSSVPCLVYLAVVLARICMGLPLS
jgi:hypothetical protein